MESPVVVSFEPIPHVNLDERISQIEVDVKALAEAVEKLMGVIQQLKAAQTETLMVMRQLLSGRSTSGN